MQITHPHFLRLGALFAFTAVLLGAFGAHALQETLAAREMSDVWGTAVDYQMWHALALIALSALPLPAAPARRIATCFGGGILLFSGSLYALALGGPAWLGPITPIGGLLLLSGWALLIFQSWRGRLDVHTAQPPAKPKNP